MSETKSMSLTKSQGYVGPSSCSLAWCLSSAPPPSPTSHWGLRNRGLPPSGVSWGPPPPGPLHQDRPHRASPPATPPPLGPPRASSRYRRTPWRRVIMRLWAVRFLRGLWGCGGISVCVLCGVALTPWRGVIMRHVAVRFLRGRWGCGCVSVGVSA